MSERISTDSSDNAALRAIAEGVEAETGERFFSSLARSLALALEVGFAFVTRISEDGTHCKLLALWERDHFGCNTQLPVKGTPCEGVLRGQIVHYPDELCARFPGALLPARLGAQSYCGVPVFDAQGRVFGHVAVLDDKPMPDGPRGVTVMRIFAARVRAEVERLHMQDALREANQRLTQSEEQFRDFFEEAPLAYVIGSRAGIIRFNRTAARILGVKPEEMAGLHWRSLFHHTPEARQLLREGVKLVESRTEACGMDLELRRREDGRPLWIQCWWKWESGGKYPRVMFFDVTDRVLMEQEKARLQAHNEYLQEENKRLQEQFRDFFEEAPLAYVVGSAAGIIRGNRTAARMFGVTPEEMNGFNWRSLFPDTAETQRRLRQALKQVEGGREACGTDLELRRKEDGRPVWVQWWSKREEGGKYARIMFLDITDRVLMEQEKTRLQTHNEYLQEEIKQFHHFDEIVGRSATLNSVLDKVRLVAPADSTVLILGETGTGKELIARAIHSASSRHERPLIKVNCAALPASLIESELFGHEKGAFTGATEKRIGRFELANGGTIFLDEIGELPTEVQIKLLRVLQERELERIGGNSTITVDIRVIAATNRDLTQAVAEGKFRRDLLYRLNVFPIVMPPLRQRPDDIPLLVHYFVQRHAGRIGRPITHVPAAAMERLTAYPWPGNIRELENVIERAVILSSGPDLELASELIPSIAVTVDDTSNAGLTTDTGALNPADGSLGHIEKEHILKVLQRTNWRIEGPNGAAAILRLNPSTLRSRMKKFGLERTRDMS